MVKSLLLGSLTVLGVCKFSHKMLPNLFAQCTCRISNSVRIGKCSREKSQKFLIDEIVEDSYLILLKALLSTAE